jgi:hypothetical protein
MNKEQFIRSKFRSLLSESLNEKVKDISEKLNLDKETKLYKDNEFDYVQEGECKECGSELYEGECKECGWKGDGDKEVMEKNERKLEKISDEEIEDLLGDIKSDMKHSKKGEEDEFEFELELDEKECVECGSSYEMKEKLYGKQHKIAHFLHYLDNEHRINQLRN